MNILVLITMNEWWDKILTLECSSFVDNDF